MKSLRPFLSSFSANDKSEKDKVDEASLRFKIYLNKVDAGKLKASSSNKNDEKLAVAQFEKLAEQNDPIGQYYLGLCFYYGIGKNKDEKESLGLFQQAAEQTLSGQLNAFEEQKKAISGAQRKVAIFFREGKCGLQKSESTALVWDARVANHEFSASISSADSSGSESNSSDSESDGCDSESDSDSEKSDSDDAKASDAKTINSPSDDSRDVLIDFYAENYPSNQATRNAKQLFKSNVNKSIAIIGKADTTLRFHQRIALTRSDVQGWMMWGENILNGVMVICPIVLKYLIVTTDFNTLSNHDYVSFKTYFSQSKSLQYHFSRFKLKMRIYEESDGFYDERATSFLTECKSLSMENKQDRQRLRESLQFEVDQFEKPANSPAVVAVAAASQPAHRQPLPPMMRIDRYYKTCKAHLLFFQNDPVIRAEALEVIPSKAKSNSL